MAQSSLGSIISAPAGWTPGMQALFGRGSALDYFNGANSGSGWSLPGVPVMGQVQRTGGKANYAIDPAVLAAIRPTYTQGATRDDTSGYHTNNAQRVMGADGQELVVETDPATGAKRVSKYIDTGGGYLGNGHLTRYNGTNFDVYDPQNGFVGDGTWDGLENGVGPWGALAIMLGGPLAGGALAGAAGAAGMGGLSGGMGVGGITGAEAGLGAGMAGAGATAGGAAAADAAAALAAQSAGGAGAGAGSAGITGLADAGALDLMYGGAADLLPGASGVAGATLGGGASVAGGAALGSAGSSLIPEALKNLGSKVGTDTLAKLGVTAATTALGGGGGGDGGAADLRTQEQQRQAKVQAAVDAINGNFGKPQRESMYSDIASAVRDNAMRDLDKQYSVASQRNKFGLARSGLLGGSVDAESGGDLTDRYQTGRLKATEAGNQAAAELRGSDERTRQNLISLAQSGLDTGSAATMAQQQMGAAADLAKSQATGATVGRLFDDVTQAYVTNQVLKTRYPNGMPQQQSSGYPGSSVFKPGAGYTGKQG